MDKKKENTIIFEIILGRRQRQLFILARLLLAHDPRETASGAAVSYHRLLLSIEHLTVDRLLVDPGRREIRRPRKTLVPARRQAEKHDDERGARHRR